MRGLTCGTPGGMQSTGLSAREPQPQVVEPGVGDAAHAPELLREVEVDVHAGAAHAGPVDALDDQLVAATISSTSSRAPVRGLSNVSPGVRSPRRVATRWIPTPANVAAGRWARASAGSQLAEQVARRHEALLERRAGQLDALLVLRQVLQAEQLGRAPQVRLDRLDAERQLRGDLLVRRRRAVRRVDERAAEGDQDAALRGREPVAGRVAVRRAQRLARRRRGADRGTRARPGRSGSRRGRPAGGGRAAASR